MLKPDVTLLSMLTKVAPALLLALLALRSSATAAGVLALGLLLAALGDGLLLHAGTAWFLGGMAAFATMHVCYILAFARRAPGRGIVQRYPAIALAYLGAAIGADVLLYPHLHGMAPAVIAYGLLLATMALAALNLLGRISSGAAVACACGGLLFMASDTALAFSMFAPGTLPFATPVMVLATYYAAQVLIVFGFLARA